MSGRKWFFGLAALVLVVAVILSVVDLLPGYAPVVDDTEQLMRVTDRGPGKGVSISSAGTLHSRLFGVVEGLVACTAICLLAYTPKGWRLGFVSLTLVLGTFVVCNCTGIGSGPIPVLIWSVVGFSVIGFRWCRRPSDCLKEL